MTQDYKRQSDQYRFAFLGMSTLLPADSLPPGKYRFAQNVRGYSPTTIQSRPGWTEINDLGVFGPIAITDMGSYTALDTDNLPRFLFRTSLDKIYLDNAVQVGTLTTDGGSGATFIPFRPGESPDSWMYIANDSDYQKFSIPSSTNAVTQANVGIEEQQSPPGACAGVIAFTEFTENAAAWAQGGTAAASADGVRVTNTVVAIYGDPDSFAGETRWSIQLDASGAYAIGAKVHLASSGGPPDFSAIVEDVIPPISPAGNLTIQSIFYFSGVGTGRCVIVPTQSPTGNPQAGFTIDPALASLRRGALVTLSGGPETVLVLSVTLGPDGIISFETNTTGAHAAAETITGEPCVVVCSNIDNTVVGQAITIDDITYAQTTGTGTQTNALATSPFDAALALSTVNPQQDDYLHFSLRIDNLALLVQGSLAFDVGLGGVDFTTDAYYYQFTIADMIGKIPSTTTLLPTSQWVELQIPIKAMIRLGTTATQSLLDARSVRLSIQSSGNINVAFGSMWIGGGGQADIGSTGSPYLYRFRGRSSTTGVRSNSSPATRHGVSPRRQRVNVPIVESVNDPQTDTWDIFRFGGSVNSWRYIGSVPYSASTTFIDNYPDEAALAGDPLEFDNFEPWPTVDVPFSAVAGTVSGVTTAIAVRGTTVTVTYSAVAAFTNPAPATILRWLPGTLLLVKGQQAYTFWNRPTLNNTQAVNPLAVPPNNFYYVYLFELVENAGSASNNTLSILEPNVANQHLPYLWGPDAFGTIFACGDTFRPGTLYYCKSYIPDSAPDTYNQELTNPSEPLLGGEILDGVSFVASSLRWWKLYQNFGTAQRYQAVEIPVGRGLAIPWGHCTDGKAIYFWAKDGIWMTGGGAGQSLTDADLYNLFPHEGIQGADQTWGAFTVRAPDYTKAATFRLAYCNNFLYATYQGADSTYSHLVLDLRTGAWSVDLYPQQRLAFYAPPQPESSLQTVGGLYPLLVSVDLTGKFFQETAGTNDGSTAIPCALATLEWNAGDIRSEEQWGDMILNLRPAAAGSPVVAAPVANGVNVAGNTTIPTSATRTDAILSLGGGILQNYLGLAIIWSDDFTQQTLPTELYYWQASYLDKPEAITDRFTDWDDAGASAAKFIQGFVIELDTFNAAKSLAIRNGDTQALEQTFNITANGQTEIAFSFGTPFIAHLVRIEPQDNVEWRFFRVRWVWEPTPELVMNWQTQGTSFGQNGYSHVKQLSVAYASTSPVNLTVTTYDGTSPATVVLPATGGAYQKATVPLSFNKGMLYFFQFSSLGGFQLWKDDLEAWVGNWNRQGPYSVFRVGGTRGDQAQI